MMSTPVTRVVMALVFFSGSMAVDRSYYRGAVVDYNIISSSSNPRDNLMANVRRFHDSIRSAAESKADIVVFPEGALMGSDHTIFVNVPDPADKVTPAGNASWDEALQTLSSYANTSNIYVVVNLHENYTDPNSKKVLKYNTNVVFNRNGTVISRYRKYHLFGEALNITKDPEYATFDTDFGVKFGQFICFDILFKEPALNLVKEHKIKNFVYPTWWFSELPFLTAPQAQWGWAVANNVNLLAAGVNHVARGSSGSSIIRGRSGFFSDTNYIFSNKTATTVIVANIPKDPSNTTAFTESGFKATILTDQNETFLMMTQPGLENATSADLDLWANQTSRRFTRKLCHDDFCCNFDLNVAYENALLDTIHYKAMAYSGNRVFGRAGGQHGIQVCGVYAYNSSATSNLGEVIFGQPVRRVTFTDVKISGNFRTSDSEIWPDVLLHPGLTEAFLPSPSDVKFTTGDTSELVWNPKKQVLSVGIFSRTFKNAASLSQMSTFALLLPVMVAVLMSLKRYY